MVEGSDIDASVQFKKFVHHGLQIVVDLEGAWLFWAWHDATSRTFSVLYLLARGKLLIVTYMAPTEYVPSKGANQSQLTVNINE